MIVDKLLDLLFGIVEWIVGLIPEWTAPAEIAGLDDLVNDWFSQYAGLGVWVPWNVIGIALSIIFGALGVNVTARLGLWAWSLVPVIGSGK